MWFLEDAKYKEEKEKKDKKEKKAENNEKIYKNMEKQKLKTDLQNLKETVSESEIDKEFLEKIKWNIDKDNNNSPYEIAKEKVTIENILEKLDNVKKFEDIDKLLPNSIIISKQEYTEALKDQEKKKLILKKLNKSLDIIYTNYRGTQTFKRSIFTNYVTLLNKNLVNLQSDFIDLKNFLNSHKN